MWYDCMCVQMKVNREKSFKITHMSWNIYIVIVCRYMFIGDQSVYMKLPYLCNNIYVIVSTEYSVKPKP